MLKNIIILFLFSSCSTNPYDISKETITEKMRIDPAFYGKPIEKIPKE